MKTLAENVVLYDEKLNKENLSINKKPKDDFLSAKELERRSIQQFAMWLFALALGFSTLGLYRPLI